MSAHTEREVRWTDHIQAWVQLLTAMFAAIAIILSVVALIGQQQVNKSQIQANNQAQERERRVYASRVSLWGGEDRKSAIRVQNRSPVPINQPIVETGRELSASSPVGDVYHFLPTIPPCTVISFLPQRTKDGSMALYPSAIYFRDAYGSWANSYGKLEESPVWDNFQMAVGAKLETIVIQSYSFKDTTDCG
jgi:hypothetical protein